jgi:hypothetical protein
MSHATTGDARQLAVEIADLTSQLLMHHDLSPIADGQPLVVHHRGEGGWGIALILDGWYGDACPTGDLDASLWGQLYRDLWPLLARYRAATERRPR